MVDDPQQECIRNAERLSEDPRTITTRLNELEARIVALEQARLADDRSSLGRIDGG